MPKAERPAMAEYGVPETLDDVLPWSWAEERLVRARNYWVATASAAGRVHSLPVWGVWLSDPDRFWFSCANGARKLRNLVANPSIVVAPDDSVEVVSLEGVARRVSADASAAAIDAYCRKYVDDPAERPAMAAFLRPTAMLEVTPERAFGVIEHEEDFARRATRWVW